MGYYKDYLYADAITWTTDGANAGTVRYRSGKFFCTNVCGVLLSEIGYANKMTSEALNKIAWRYVSKVGNPKLMNNIMSEIEFLLPVSIREQTKISNFLGSLDNLITLHQRKCCYIFNLIQRVSALPNLHLYFQVLELCVNKFFELLSC